MKLRTAPWIGRAAFIVALLDIALVWIWWDRATAAAAGRVPLDRADAAIVFFGDWGEQTEARVETAAGLMKSGQVTSLIVVGGCRPKDGRNGGDLMLQLAEQAGVDRSRLFADACSYDTLSNLQGAADIAARQQFYSFVFVSDVFHLQRIHRLADGFPSLAQARDAVGERASPLWAWLRVHSEIVAGVVDALPADWREAVMRSLRGQPSAGERG